MNQHKFGEAKELLHAQCSRQLPNINSALALLEVFGTLDKGDIFYQALDNAYDDVLEAIKDNNVSDMRVRIARAINVTKLFWAWEDGDLRKLAIDRSKVAEGKREDYTKGDEDVLKNFKNQAEAFGIRPTISLGVHMEKQMSAVLNYIKTDGQSESEPIIKRVGDVLNYLELLWGVWLDMRTGNPMKWDTVKIEDNEDKSIVIEDDEIEDEGDLKVTAICTKCQQCFDSKEARERSCEQPQFICPHK